MNKEEIKEDAGAEDSLADAISAAFDAAEEELAPEGLEEAPEEQTSHPTEEEKPEQTEVEAKEEATSEEPAVEPPHFWTREQKEMFATLPRETQEYLVEREQQQNRLVQTAQEDASKWKRKFEPIQDVFSERQELIERLKHSGVSEAQYLRSLLAADAAFEQNPVQTVAQLLARRGISPEAFMEAVRGSQQNGQAPAFDPRVEQLNAELTELRSSLQQQAEAAKQAQQNQVVDYVQNFFTQQDENGQPLFPHYRDVATSMPNFIKDLRAENPDRSHDAILKEAYERAVWAHPVTREQKLRAEKEALAQAEREAVKEAKRAGSSVKGSSSGTNGLVPDDDIRAQLESLLPA